MRRDQPRPASNGAVVKQQDSQGHQRRVSLARIIDERVAPENRMAQSHLSSRYHFSVSAMPPSSGVLHSKPIWLINSEGSQTQPGARSSANFWRFNSPGLPLNWERNCPKRQTGQSSTVGMGQGTVQPFICAAMVLAIKRPVI